MIQEVEKGEEEEGKEEEKEEDNNDEDDQRLARISDCYFSLNINQTNCFHLCPRSGFIHNPVHSLLPCWQEAILIPKGPWPLPLTEEFSHTQGLIQESFML